MNYNKIKNTADETETLNADDEKLHRLLGGLKKVGAPKDFDFKLKARIANTQPRDLRRPVLLPFLRYALPLGVIVLLAGFVFFNLSLSNGNQDAPQIVRDNFQPVQIDTAPPESVVAPPSSESFNTAANTNVNSENKRDVPETGTAPKKPVQDKQYIAVKNPPRNQTEKTENTSKNSGRGSVDSTLRDAPVVLELNKNTNSDNSNPTSIARFNLSIREVLSGIGIEVDYVGNGWKILSIQDNSIAMRSDMRVGDVIESVDGRKLSSDTAFVKTFRARIFRILRGGEQVLIDLTAKQ